MYLSYNVSPIGGVLTTGLMSCLCILSLEDIGLLMGNMCMHSQFHRAHLNTYIWLNSDIF